MRRSALQASWRRDRWVGRRRLAWRWLVWASWRYLMPAAGVLGLLMLLWFAVVRPVLGWNAVPPTDLSPARIQPGPAALTLNIRPEPEPAPDTAQTPLKLHFDTASIPTPTPRPSAPASSPASPEPTPAFTPHLKPENWLHSKEP